MIFSKFYRRQGMRTIARIIYESLQSGVRELFCYGAILRTFRGEKWAKGRS